MATIQNSLRLHDGMTGSLQTITSSMNKVITTFELMERTSSHAIDTTVLRGARVEMTHVSTAVVGMERNIQAAAGHQENFNQKIRDGAGAASKMKSITKGLSNIRTGIKNIKMGVQFVTDATSLQIAQNQAESKLAVTMRKRMGASPEDIQSIKNLSAAQQHLGVISDEVQLSGAQQMATFINSSSALNTLVPAMNDLAVQQNGVNVTSQDVIDIGSMMGKAMQGQVDALTSVGITFDAAQAHVLKYGNEQERAAVLAEAVTNNVGNMNEIMASTPQGQIQQLANTWGNIKEMVGAKLYTALTQFFSILSSNMPFVENLVIGLAGVLNLVITMMGWLVSGAGEVVSFFQNNWSVIEPVIWGIVGALAAYNVATALQAFWTGTSAIATFLHALATQSLTEVLLSCPLMWVAIAIGVVIAAIVAWVHSVGGLKVAWLICVDAVLTQADMFKWGLLAAWNGIQNGIDNMQLGFTIFKVGVLNILGNLKVLGLTILQDFINGAIDRINSLISFAQKIGVTSLELIPHVEFATSAAVEEQAAQQQRAADIAAQRIQNAADRADRAEGQRMAFNRAKAAHAERQAQIEATRADAGNGAKDNAENSWYSGVQESWDDIAGNTGKTAGNTEAMADSMGMMDEDLKYMRDMAEQEIINRFTTAELTVQMGGITNQINGQMDLDGIGDYLGNVIFETLETAAEGVY